MIYRGKCSCGEEYTGEIERIVKKRWSEHNNPADKTEPARHLFITLVTCLRGKFLCLLQKTNEHVKTWKCFLLQFKNYN